MSSKCVNIRRNLDGCTCTYTACDRRGLCCECVAAHRRNGEIPGCFFPPEWERKYDRSIDAFLEAHGRR